MKLVIELSKEALEFYMSPMVYLFIRKQGAHSHCKDYHTHLGESISELMKNGIECKKVLYVGKSKNGIQRPFSPTHQASEARKLSNEVQLHICDTEREALDLEIKLIKKYKPKYNSPWHPGHTNLNIIEDTQNTIKKQKSELEADKLINRGILTKDFNDLGKDLEDLMIKFRK